jgi:hypothetical protein
MRKCTSKSYGGNLVFHKYIEFGETQIHGEDPQKDCCYVKTYALVENLENGQMEYYEPKEIIFTDNIIITIDDIENAAYENYNLEHPNWDNTEGYCAFIKGAKWYHNKLKNNKTFII